jgi:hypothetical protein
MARACFRVLTTKIFFICSMTFFKESRSTWIGTQVRWVIFETMDQQQKKPFRIFKLLQLVTYKTIKLIKILKKKGSCGFVTIKYTHFVETQKERLKSWGLKYIKSAV